MDTKESLQKLIDNELNWIKFWQIVVFSLVSAFFGIFFAYTQNKLLVNSKLIILICIGFMLFIAGVFLVIKYQSKVLKLIDNLKRI